MTGNATWDLLKRFTDARIGLGRSGPALPTQEVLKFAMAHAQARDAVRTPMEWAEIEQGSSALGFKTFQISSSATDRDTYLRRPDLGRRLSSDTAGKLSALKVKRPDLVILIGDGLSSTAVTANVVAMMQALAPYLKDNNWQVSPLLLANQARVALGDDAGEFLSARAVLVLIGERPGLSSPDSLGAYLTWAPRVGTKDAERNCISNIRQGGLSYQEAAFKLGWLMREMFKRQLTGVQLKDESNYQLEARTAAKELPRS
jgi:ethanolamine ammonia-lyase small subunit